MTETHVTLRKLSEEKQEEAHALHGVHIGRARNGRLAVMYNGVAYTTQIRCGSIVYWA